MAYAPETTPHSQEDMGFYVEQELNRIADALGLAEFNQIQFKVWQESPPKPRAGMVAYGAAGAITAAEGLHEYLSTGWTKI